MAAALRLALALNGGVLPIQGPPGSGKTYTGARMITAMANAGLRVGVTANSHKVIRNLLDGVRQASDELGLDLPCIQKISEPTPDEPGLQFATENARAEAGRRDHLFTWTADGLLRHTVYVGLRGDKPPDQVRREVARG